MSIDSVVPEGILVDLITINEEANSNEFVFKEAQDIGLLLKSIDKAVLFAVPGAFTPTCSLQHLPGFIKLSSELKAKGVNEIFCLSVNDRFVMRAWGDNTPEFKNSGIKLIADGNGEYTKALGQVKDATGSRLGLRSNRYAAIIEKGIIKVLNVDSKGMVDSSAEAILALL
eukprot:gene18549-24270_t